MGRTKTNTDAADTENDFVRALRQRVSLEDMREIAENAVELAKAGNASARAWVSTWVMGKPQGSAPPLTVVMAPGVDQDSTPPVRQRRRFADDFDESEK
jgi:hypothetical protein